jgi:hypothetical protein
MKHIYSLFKTWLLYVVFRKKLSQMSITCLEKHYKFTTLEKKLFEKIKKINQK